jgi:hypothetical protein
MYMYAYLKSGWPDEFVEKIAQNVAQYIFVRINAYTPLTVEKKLHSPKILATSVIFKKNCPE